MLQIKVFFFVLTVGLFLSDRTHAQNVHTIKLNVRDSLTQQTLSNAYINIVGVDTLMETNKQGQISVDLQKDFYTIIISAPDVKPKSLYLKVQKDTVIHVNLSPLVKHFLIPEVQVNGNHYNKSENVYTGLERVSPLTIKSFPSIMGEKDIVKTLSSLPGVTQGSEGSADIYVRGGTSDQNLFLIDGNTVYHPSHLFGLFSSVVPEIVKEVDFYKGSFPVDYGGKLSSVIDIKTKDPLQENFNVKAELGTLSGKLTMVVPVIKDKTSILFSARATHYDKLLKYFLPSDEYSLAGFYELFGKIGHKINENSDLTIDVYLDRDYYLQGEEGDEYSGKELFHWKNQFVSAKYVYRFNQNSTLQTTAGWTTYKMQINEESIKKDSTLNYTKDFNSYISDKYLKLLFDKKSGTQLNLLIGGDYTFHDILPATTENKNYDTYYQQSLIPSSVFHEFSAFASNTFSPYEKLKIQAGARFTGMLNSSSQWYSVDPRINVQYQFDNDNSLKFSYTKVSQAIHLLTNPGLGMPIDINIPFTEEYKPESATQYSIATNFNKMIFGETFYMSVEAYYKQMDNIVSYLPGTSSRDFTSFTSSNQKELEDIVTTGKGKSYGIEFLVEKRFGKINGRLAYTLSGIKHQFDELNNGKEFYAQHHRPHNFVIVASYNINKNNILSANFNYMSGARTTLPIYMYSKNYFGIAGDYTFESLESSVPFYAQSEINEYKMQDCHTLNLSYLYKFSKKKWNGEWELSIYNVYNRKNPYYYYLDYKYEVVTDESSETGYDRVATPTLISVSLFRLIPSLTFRMSF
jgi:hypothetical protein